MGMSFKTVSLIDFVFFFFLVAKMQIVPSKFG